MKLEVEIIPVSDVDRAREFYERRAGGSTMTSRRWTAFGSSSSRPRLRGLGDLRPGTHDGRSGSAGAGLTVSDIEAAHAEVVGRGVEVSGIWHGPPFPVEARQPGPDPERTSYGSFFSFADPDGNTWLVQEVTARLPGRMNASETGYVSVADLESALRRAEAAHREHERRSGRSAQTTRNGPPGTPRTWWPSRPGPPTDAE